jgi:hypothetical protein
MRGCRIRRGASRGARSALKLRPMHGMLSAAILIGVCGVVAAACLYVVIRVFLAGAH